MAKLVFPAALEVALKRDLAKLRAIERDQQTKTGEAARETRTQESANLSSAPGAKPTSAQ